MEPVEPGGLVAQLVGIFSRPCLKTFISQIDKQANVLQNPYAQLQNIAK